MSYLFRGLSGQRNFKCINFKRFGEIVINYQFTFNITEEDYLEFLKFNNKNSEAMQRRSLLFRFTFPITAALICFMYFFSSNSSIERIIGCIAVISLLAAWILLYDNIQNSKLSEYMSRFKKNGKFIYDFERVLTFDDEFIITQSESGESKYRYIFIDKICKGNLAVYIYRDILNVYIIPNRVFKNQNEIDDFIAFIDKKINYNKV